MNRSYSKIRHIQEANRELEKRVLSEKYSHNEETTINNDNEELDEQLGSMIKSGVKYVKNLIYPEIKVLRSSVDAAKSGAKGSTQVLLQKFGSVELTSYVKSLVEPLNAEIKIITNDIKRIQQYKIKPEAGKSLENVNLLNSTSDQMVRSISFDAKNAYKSSIDFGQIYQNLTYLNKSIDKVIASKEVTSNGITILKNTKNNVNDALEEIERVLGVIATK